MFAQWTKQYGDVFRVVLGNREAVSLQFCFIVIGGLSFKSFQLSLNTHAAVAKTLVQQGAAFQSRPEFNLWHGAFSKALDHDAPTTIGSKFGS
jgi:hypothetical protein